MRTNCHNLRRRRKIRRLLTALQPLAPERVYVFGSWARGEEDELSDLDVVVIKKTTQPFFERLAGVARLLPQEIGPVDLLIYTPDEFADMLRRGNALAETVAAEGVLIYGREEPY